MKQFYQIVCRYEKKVVPLQTVSKTYYMISYLLLYLFLALGVSFVCSLLESTLMSTTLSYINLREEEGYKPAFLMNLLIVKYSFLSPVRGRALLSYRAPKPVLNLVVLSFLNIDLTVFIKDCTLSPFINSL